MRGNPTSAKTKEYFAHRPILGAWINDLSSVPRVEPWPSTRFDTTLKRDLVGFLDLMQEAGFNSAVFFGLFVAAAWDRDFRKSISPERGRLARWLLDAAHQRGIRILYGIGLYSWGFDKIIREQTEIAQRQQDVADHFGSTSRREIIAALQCAYGTRSGTWVYPPQRWPRLRWFLPLIDRRASHYRRLAEDGGQAVMVSGGPLVNPGEEATLRFSGKMIRSPFGDVSRALRETMDEMFEPRTTVAADDLAGLFWFAEKAYFANAWSLENYEIHLEPLFGRKPGPPLYLQNTMNHLGLVEYDRAIQNIGIRLVKIKGDLANRDKVRRLEQCLGAVRRDIRAIIRHRRMLPQS